MIEIAKPQTYFSMDDDGSDNIIDEAPNDATYVTLEDVKRFRQTLKHSRIVQVQNCEFDAWSCTNSSVEDSVISDSEIDSVFQDQPATFVKVGLIF